jgi:hypothetical protein
MLESVSRLRLAGLACAVSLAAAGCSDDEEPEAVRAPATEAAAPRTESRATTSPGTGLSAAEYRRKINALCVEDKRLAERLGEPSTADGLVRYLRRTLDLNKKREPKYRAVEPPAALRRDHRASLELSDEIEKELQDTLDRIEDGGDPAVELPKVLPALGRAVEEGNAISRRLGTRKCIVEVPNPAAQPDENTS